MSGATLIDGAILYAKQRLGLAYLKDLQMEAMKSFAKQQDTFVALPTGYGKSIIYAMLPYVFDQLRGE